MRINQATPKTIKSNLILRKNKRSTAKSNPVITLLSNALRKIVPPIDNKSCMIFSLLLKKKRSAQLRVNRFFLSLSLILRKVSGHLPANSLTSDETSHNRVNHVALIFLAKDCLYINHTQLTPDDSSGTCWHVQILF